MAQMPAWLCLLVLLCIAARVWQTTSDSMFSGQMPRLRKSVPLPEGLQIRLTLLRGRHIVYTQPTSTSTRLHSWSGNSYASSRPVFAVCHCRSV